MCLVISSELHDATGTASAKRGRRRDVEVDGAGANHGNLFLRALAPPIEEGANALPEPLVRTTANGRLLVKGAEATVGLAWLAV